jgi:hypothetical protein
MYIIIYSIDLKKFEIINLQEMIWVVLLVFVPESAFLTKVYTIV